MFPSLTVPDLLFLEYVYSPFAFIFAESSRWLLSGDALSPFYVYVYHAGAQTFWPTDARQWRSLNMMLRIRSRNRAKATIAVISRRKNGNKQLICALSVPQKHRLYDTHSVDVNSVARIRSKMRDRE